MFLTTYRSTTWARWMLVLSFLLVSIAAVVPQGSKAETVTVLSIGLDKILHLVGFAFMALFALASGRGCLYWKRIFLILGVLVFGLLIESVQFYLSYRTFNPLDILANVCGVGVGMMVWFWLMREGFG